MSRSAAAVTAPPTAPTAPTDSVAAVRRHLLLLRDKNDIGSFCTVTCPTAPAPAPAPASSRASALPSRQDRAR